MNSTKSIRNCLACGLILLLVSGIFLPGLGQRAYASDRGGSSRQRDFRDSRPREFRDSRHRLDRSFPTRGFVTRALPRDHRIVTHGRTRFFFSAGVWYRPYGSSFIVVAPPVGLFVPFLPPYYATVWVGGVPYYYANEVYYAHRGSGYVVVEPPKSDVSEAPPPADKLFVYPRLGQSEQQKADDEYDCHRWAVDQTGFDPTQQPSTGQKPADYQRAMAACLDGRGYTVK